MKTQRKVDALYNWLGLYFADYRTGTVRAAEKISKMPGPGFVTDVRRVQTSIVTLTENDKKAAALHLETLNLVADLAKEVQLRDDMIHALAAYLDVEFKPATMATEITLSPMKAVSRVKATPPTKKTAKKPRKS